MRMLSKICFGIFCFSALMGSAVNADPLPPSGGVVSQPTVSKNIVADFRAVCDGKTDGLPLSRPSTNGQWLRPASFSSRSQAGAFARLRAIELSGGQKASRSFVVGYGATITNNGSSNPAFFLGGRGQVRTTDIARGWLPWRLGHRKLNCLRLARPRCSPSETMHS